MSKGPSASLIALCTLTSTMSFLRVSGAKIVDAQGSEVVLRGAGLGGWMWYDCTVAWPAFSCKYMIAHRRPSAAWKTLLQVRWAAGIMVFTGIEADGNGPCVVLVKDFLAVSFRSERLWQKYWANRRLRSSSTR